MFDGNPRLLGEGCWKDVGGEVYRACGWEPVSDDLGLCRKHLEELRG